MFAAPSTAAAIVTTTTVAAAAVVAAPALVDGNTAAHATIAPSRPMVRSAVHLTGRLLPLCVLRRRTPWRPSVRRLHPHLRRRQAPTRRPRRPFRSADLCRMLLRRRPLLVLLAEQHEPTHKLCIRVPGDGVDLKRR